MSLGRENLVHCRQFRDISHDIHPEKGMDAHIHIACAKFVHPRSSWREERLLLAQLEHAVVTSATGETGNRFARALIWCKFNHYLVLSATSIVDILVAGSFLLAPLGLQHGSLQVLYPFLIPMVWLFSLSSVILVLCPKHINTLFDQYTRSLAIT
jgi:hypothetical protein